ncbi:MAG: lysophospholipid acyltransferase family protein [Sphingobacteriaceae bacterium]
MISRILFIIPYTLLYLFSLLPFRVIYILSDGLYYLLYHIIGYRKDTVRKNLLNSFPKKPLAEIQQIEKKYFRFLADNLLESFKIMGMSEKSLNKRFKLKNPEVVQQYFDRNQAILLAMSHYANWEWAAPGLNSLLKTKIIMVYKPLTNKNMEKLINNIRTKYGGLMVPMKQTVRTITEHQGQTYMAALVSDQTPSRHDKNHFITFLNQATSVFQGLEKIGKLTGNPIVYMNVNRIKRGYYEAEFKVLFENPKQTEEFEITETYNRELENIIKAKPEYWLWSHKRWKHQPPAPHEN